MIVLIFKYSHTWLIINVIVELIVYLGSKCFHFPCLVVTALIKYFVKQMQCIGHCQYRICKYEWIVNLPHYSFILPQNGQDWHQGRNANLGWTATWFRIWNMKNADKEDDQCWRSDHYYVTNFGNNASKCGHNCLFSWELCYLSGWWCDVSDIWGIVSDIWE